ncbi:MAG: SH3 domain-containing protein [Christensenellales bacterium]
MKRVLLVFVCAVIIVTLFPITAAHASESYFEEATVIAEDVNLRLRPTTDSPVVTVLKNGARIGVYCEEQPGWYRVIFGNYRGYVSSEYIFLSSIDTVIGHVVEDGLHVRLYANEYSDIVCDLDVGEGVTITDIIGDWYYAKSNNNEGYVYKDFIKLSTTKSTSALLKPGMEGVAIADMQRELRSRGFFSGPITGYYGDLTLLAIQAFQKEARISQDGIVGEATLELLYGDNDIKTNAAKMAGIEGQVQLSSWDEIGRKWKKGTNALVTDVKTGLQYTAYRFGGWYHADCEPLTAKDTATMKKIFGGGWTWNRRPIWVTINGVTYAASQHGMPHMVDVIKGNDFPGHFCIHFYHSKVHETSKECPRHQPCVMKAYKAAQ